jgi:hypothetical protein
MQPAITPIPFDWRPATPVDVSVLAALYRDAALRLGPLVYTAEQPRAWASSAEDLSAFPEYVPGANTWIAERVGDGRALGFCGVGTDGAVRDVHSLQVTPPRTRQALGGAMPGRTLERA